MPESHFVLQTIYRLEALAFDAMASKRLSPDVIDVLEAERVRLIDRFTALLAEEN